MAGAKKKFVALLLVLLVVSAGYFFLTRNAPKAEFDPETYVPSPEVKNCVFDLQCLRDAGLAGEKAVAFVEEQPEQYTPGELSQYAARGELPPERKGPVFSHTIKECSGGNCTVAVKLERLPSPQELPDWVLAIIMPNPTMMCNVPVQQLGTVPDDKTQCSGPLVDNINRAEEEAAKIRGES